MGNTHVKPHPRTRNKKVRWKAADRPFPPGKPQLLTENEATPDLITIRWPKPLKDGGSSITGYLVEHRRTGSPHWVRATPMLIPFPELTISGLEPGWRYQFRVSAENAVGLSDPGELSEPITVTLQRSAITAPRFTEELLDSVALENEKAEFIVHFLGQPAPKVCWYKDGFEIFSSRRIRIFTEHDRSILTIHQCALSDEGEIKCTATNRAGHVATKAKLMLEAPPSIRLPRNYEEGILFEMGEEIRLKVSVAGRPTPLVFWNHNGESVQNNERYEIENVDRSSMLKIKEALRTDRGEYQIKAVNKLGEDSSTLNVTVTDKPSPPGKARVIMTLGRSVTLSWSTPADDGGCKIGNYIIEYYRLGWNVWLKAANSRQLTTMLGDLLEGSEYKFRVKAESPYGISDPSEETDIVFIPDPKRGITQPNQHRGRSQPRDISDEFASPIAAKRKKPRSQSSGRVLDESLQTFDSNIQNTISNAGIPKRPMRSKIKSPSKTPERSPIVARKVITNSPINRTIFDRSSMARDLSYGSPDIKIKKERDATSDYLLSYSSSEKSKTPSPMFQRKKQPDIEVSRLSKSPSPTPDRSRSPSPSTSRNRSPREFNDNFTGSSEFMLVLHDGNEKGQRPSSDFVFDDDALPLTISISCPELNGYPNETLYNLRNSLSSTELLHQKAIMRFYKAAKAEEAELEKKRKLNESRRTSVDIPKIQINSLDNQEIVGLEQRHSFRRRLSASSISQQQILSTQRRQSLKNSKELADILPQTSLYKYPYTLEDKRQLMMSRQRSDSEELEEQELDKIRQTINVHGMNVEKRKISVVNEEEWADDYEESTDEETESEIESEDERHKFDLAQANKFQQYFEEDETYHPRPIKSKTPNKNEPLEVLKSTLNDNEPFEILTKRKVPPDPNFVPKPILKKKSAVEPQPVVLTNNKEKKNYSKRAHSPIPIDFLQRERSQSLVEQLLDPLTFIPSGEKMFGSKKTIKGRQRSFSLGQQKEISLKIPPVIQEKEEKSPSPLKHMKAVAEATVSTGAGIIIPEKLLDKKLNNEEAKVVIDHYGDIVRNYGSKRRSNPQLYNERESLKNLAQINAPPVQNFVDKEPALNPSKEHHMESESTDIIELKYNIVSNATITYKKETSPIQEFNQLRNVSPSPTREIKKTYPSLTRLNKREKSPVHESRRKRSVSPSPIRNPKNCSQSPSRRDRRSITKSPTRPENWSTLKSTSEKPPRKSHPSYMRKQYRKKSQSPVAYRDRSRSKSPMNFDMRRQSFTKNSYSKSPSPKPSSLKPRPILREIMTQTSTDLESFSADSRTSTPIWYSNRQEELIASAGIKVRSTVDYLTDLAMFVVACWVYLFNNELFAIPILIVMIYRQLATEIRKRIPNWLLKRFKKKGT